MKVTIVISNFNYARFVNSAIESCLAQTVPCEIIVVDDASSDDSWEVIKRYVSKGVKAVRLSENSRGNARGKNVGICLSSAPCITCLDSDDLLLPDSIEKRLKYIDCYDFVHGWSLRSYDVKSYRHTMKKEQHRLNNFVLKPKAKKLKKEPSGPRWAFAIEASTVLANRSLYKNFGLYDEEMRWTIDREMWWRWLSHGATKKPIEEYVSIYRQHPHQITKDRSIKDPKSCSFMLKQKIKQREDISSENTLLMDSYDPNGFIDQVLA